MQTSDDLMFQNSKVYMSLKPIKRKGLSSDITERILELIRLRQYKPGEKLPSERELVDMLEVSRPSLREAMSSLAFMNVVEIRQGDGTYITSLEPQLLVEHLDFVFTLNDSTRLQLLQARQKIEPGIAEIAAIKITLEELDDLEACITQMTSIYSDIPQYVDVDIRFHQIIVEASGNPFLKQVMSSLTYMDRIARISVLECMSDAEQAQAAKQVQQEHTIILDALKRHDPMQAVESMATHIESIERLVRRVLHEETRHNS